MSLLHRAWSNLHHSVDTCIDILTASKSHVAKGTGRFTKRTPISPSPGSHLTAIKHARRECLRAASVKR